MATAMATIPEEHQRIAAAVLCCGSRPVCSWELACEEPAELEAPQRDDEFLGYGVDSGTGCFASPSALEAAVMVLLDDDGTVTDPLSTAYCSSEPRAVVVRPRPDVGAIAMFETGWGDGVYPTWFGLDRRGEVAVVVTDFLLADEP